jgi:hypothetical protein
MYASPQYSKRMSRRPCSHSNQLLCEVLTLVQSYRPESFNLYIVLAGIYSASFYKYD